MKQPGISYGREETDPKELARKIRLLQIEFDENKEKRDKDARRFRFVTWIFVGMVVTALILKYIK